MNPDLRPDFILPGEVLAAKLDQLQAVIDEAPAPDGRRGAGLPLYGVGAGFVQRRDGRRLDRDEADRCLTQHLASTEDPHTGALLQRHARRCADELAEVIRLSFPDHQEAAE